MWKHLALYATRRRHGIRNHHFLPTISIPRRRSLPASFSTSNDDKGNDNNLKNDDDRSSTNQESEKFAMPDRDMELKLASIQSQISEHYKQGDFSKALKVSKQLFQQSQAHFGQNHPATASALNNMGLMEKLLGDFVESRRHYTAALRTYAKVVGRDHASYAMTLHNLASLNKAQVHFDTTLKATERLTLVETALEYFEEAYAIRKAELGPEHPLTIATQSSWGSTLAAQVLHQHRHVGQPNAKAKYVSLNPETVTQQGWEAAEHHLRQALDMAIKNPRGKTMHTSTKPKQKKNVTSQKTKSNTATTTAAGNAPTIATLSAAAAAQNLAVFLKSRAMTEDPYNLERMQQAKTLYDQVLLVREQLLPHPQHPDLLATKYSMAELLDAMGDETAANAIRQEILDGYEPSTPDQANDEETTNATQQVPLPQVVIEKTTFQSTK